MVLQCLFIQCGAHAIHKCLSGGTCLSCSKGLSSLLCPPFFAMKQYEISLSISVLPFPLKCPTLRSHHLATLCVFPVAFHDCYSHTGISKTQSRAGSFPVQWSDSPLSQPSSFCCLPLKVNFSFLWEKHCLCFPPSYELTHCNTG